MFPVDQEKLLLSYSDNLELIIIIGGGALGGGSGVVGAGGAGGQDPSHALERWSVMEAARGTFGPDDSVADIVEIKFERPVPIKVRKYYHMMLMLHT